MKKLLLLTVAITSVMAHAMESTEEKQQAAAMVFTRIPVVISAQTELGKISRIQGPKVTVYAHEAITTVEFNQTTQRFYGMRHDADHLNCQQIENQVEAETLFNQYKTAFDAAPNKTRKFNI